MNYSEYHNWVEQIKNESKLVKEAYVLKLVKEFSIPVVIVRRDLGLEIEDSLVSVSSAIEEAIKFVELPRFNTGFSNLDYFLNGFWAGQNIVIAGRTRTGKTTLALNLIKKFVEQEKPVLFLSLEMNAGRIAERLIRMRFNFTEDDLYTLIKKGLAETYFVKFLEEYSDYLTIYDKGAVQATDLNIILAKALDSVKNPPEIVLIDYFEYIKLFGKSQYEKAFEVSKILADFGKNNNITLFVLHQCNRAAEGEPIQLTHIRGAGEEDADLIIGLWRPYLFEEEEESSDTLYLELKILKNRDGGYGDCALKLDTKTGLLTETEKIEARKENNLKQGLNDDFTI